MAEPQVESVVAQPSPGLRRWVTQYIGYRIIGAPPGVHRGLPSRHLTLIVTLDGAVEMLAMPDPAQPPQDLQTLVGGLHSAPVLINQSPVQHGIQLELTPSGARALLGLPAGELGGTVLDLEALLGRIAGELLDRVRSAPGWPESFRALDEVLAAQVVEAGAPDPEVGWAWHRLRATGGALPIGELAAEVGWSRRHLSARFRSEFGLTPKEAARVLRFEKACTALRSGHTSLADVAAICGYFDQAHMTRDWRDLAGCPPTQWLTEEFPSVQDSFPCAAAPLSA